MQQSAAEKERGRSGNIIILYLNPFYGSDPFCDLET